MTIRIDNLTVALSGQIVVDDAHLLAQAGQVTGVLGPNGSGKSTLLRTVYQHLAPQRGRIWHNELDLTTLRRVERARRIAAVPQQADAHLDGTVSQLVALGRTPHKGPFSADTTIDRRIVAESLERTGLAGYADRLYATLSGGEQQRALLARALAQQAPVLVLDEPMNHLDARHQLDILELIRELAHTTLIALHDLPLAARYCDRVVVLQHGSVVARGEPADVLTTDLLADVFGVAGDMVTHPRTGHRHLVISPLH